MNTKAVDQNLDGMETMPLQIIDILKFAASAHAKREIVSRLVDEPLWRYDYARWRGLASLATR